MTNPPAQFKAYYMVTSRCNLKCDYCVLENSSEQLARELPLADKKALIRHLYDAMGFRQLTISGGEALLIGSSPPADFCELIKFIECLPEMRVHLYTNGIFLDDRVADAIKDVVDEVSITVDTFDERVLRRLGRKAPGQSYKDAAAQLGGRLTARGIRVKLHSVVGQVNVASLPDECATIAHSFEREGGCVSSWKFYQYMSYDHEQKDSTHAIDDSAFARCISSISARLLSSGIPLHFKSTQEMNESLFNILPYGNAQYMIPNDTWKTSRRTRDLRSYASLEDLFAQHDINEVLFRRYHELRA
jgi:molybdenum cofactor biosynthesis enzyme MoaA